MSRVNKALRRTRAEKRLRTASLKIYPQSMLEYRIFKPAYPGVQISVSQ